MSAEENAAATNALNRASGGPISSTTRYGAEYANLTVHAPFDSDLARPWGNLLAAAGAGLGALEEGGAVIDVLHLEMRTGYSGRYIHVGFLRAPGIDAPETDAAGDTG